MVNNQPNIRKILEYNISIKSNRYELVGLIHMPSYDHYTASIFNNNFNNNYIVRDNYYYNDAFKNNSMIYHEKFDKNNLDNYLIKEIIVSAIIFHYQKKYNII